MMATGVRDSVVVRGPVVRARPEESRGTLQMSAR